MDRYASLDIARDPAQQTTVTDITYTIPGLEKVKSLQLVAFYQAQNSALGWSSPSVPTNVINVIYNGVTKLLVLPYDAVYLYSTLLGFVLPVFLRDNSVNFTSQPFQAGGYSFQTYITTPNASPLRYSAWKSNVGTLGFSRVTTYNGVDISGQTQLFDLLGMGYQTVSGVVVSQVAAIGQWASGTSPGFSADYTNFSPAFQTIASPDLDPLYPDLTTSATLSSIGTIIARNLATGLSNTAYNTTSALGSGTGLLKSLRTNGKNTLRIRLGDTNGNPLPTIPKIPAVMRYVSQTGSSTLVGSGTTAVITVAGTPAFSLSGIVAGDSIAVFTSVSSATGIAVNGVYTVTGVTSNTVTISFGTQTTFTGTATTTTIGGPFNAGGVSSVGGIAEYIATFVVDYGTNVPVITSPILS
jgi:hypothetical protein